MDYEDKYIFCSGNLPNRSYAIFKEKREHFCDVTLNVGERTIAANRMILSAAIPYFFKVFYEKDLLNSHEKFLTFPDIDPGALGSLIDFAYTCQVEINEENVKALMSAAFLLEVDQVRDECFRFLVNRLNFKNAMSTRDFLCHVCSSEELEKVDSYIRGNFEEVSQSADFLNLSFDVVKSIIESDDLKVNREESVFETVMKWVKQWPEERKHHLPHLLSTVRMHFIKPSYIKSCILKEEFIRTSTECRDLIDEAMYYHLVLEDRNNVCSFVTRQRSSAKNLCKNEVDENSRICILYRKMEHRIETLDSESEKWKSSSVHYEVLEHKHTATELNKKLFVFFPNMTYVYDMERNTFLFCKGMKVPRIWAGAVTQGNMLYVLGGCKPGALKDSQLNAAECFDPNTEEWFHLAKMGDCRGAPGVVADKEFIYVLGGRVSDSCVSKSVERYDVKTEMWTIMPPMLYNRCALGCAVLKEKIYVCGGQSSSGELTSAEVFDPITSNWKLISSMATSRSCCKLISFCGKLYCLGGETDKANSNAVEVYEMQTDKWKYGPPTEQNLAIVGAAVVNVTSI